MVDLNKVFLMGNLTKDPELKYLPSGTGVCHFGLATHRRWTDREGQVREETTFVDIETWGRSAETCAEYLKKGRSVFVEGRLKLDKWESPEGQRRSKVMVRADRVQFLDRRDSVETKEASNGPGNPPF